MRAAVSQAIRSILKVDWSKFETLAALRCTVGVAAPLLVGLAIDQMVVGVFGAVGAVGVGFGSFQGAYRGRAAVMLLATAGMAFSVLVGSLAGHSTALTIAVAALWAFAGGLLVAIGQGASFVGLQSIVAVLIAGGFPSDLGVALGRAALVLAGGLGQTFLVVMIWPLRRFPVERRNLAAIYRTLASYASTIHDRKAAPPEPHTFAGTPSPLADPQPFAASHQAFGFQALLDEAERIRASLASLAIHHRRFEEVDEAGTQALIELSARTLSEVAAALEEGREPRERPEFTRYLGGQVGRLSSGSPVESLLAQIRGAWRTAGGLSAPAQLTLRREKVNRRRRRPFLRDAVITLRANLTRDSTAFRHAMRLAVVLTVAAAAARLFDLPRGYWMPLTIALVLKPDFHDTFSFSMARVGGTVLGAAGATAIAVAFAPDPIWLIVLVLAFVWGGYGFATANYGAFSICITGYVIFLMMLAGIPEVTAAADRTIYTVIAGALALSAYIVWPTWTATEARPAIAAMLESQSGYIGSLLAAYAAPSRPDLHKLDELRASARLARSNAEAVVERMLDEPPTRHAMRPRTAAGILGATRRNALAALSLHAGLDGEVPAPVSGMADFADRVASGLLTLARAVRQRSTPPPLPPLRASHFASVPEHNDLVSDEADLIGDSVETIAELIARDAADRDATAMDPDYAAPT